MKSFLPLLCAVLGAPALAGDLWELTSTSTSPGVPAQTHSETQCLPADGMDPARLMPEMELCKYLQKSGTTAALRFVLDCQLPGMPAEIASIRVSGDAHLVGSHFDMRYDIRMTDASGAAASDFSMSGSLDGRKAGTCSSR